MFILMKHTHGLIKCSYGIIKHTHRLIKCMHGLIKYMPVLINICTDKKKLHNKLLKLNVHTS